MARKLEFPPKETASSLGDPADNRIWDDVRNVVALRQRVTRVAEAP